MNEKRLSAALTTLAVSIVLAAIILEMGGTRPANAAPTDQDAYSCRSSAAGQTDTLDVAKLPAYMRTPSYPD
ncbi:MAG: hypothetical protein ACR2QR_01865 [Woeseiaceae bacterium]